jgi:hypothetical protein
MSNEREVSIVGDFSAGWGLALAIPAIITFAVFVYVGEEGRGEVAAAACISLLASVKIFWPLRRQLWFWITLICIAMAHFAALLWIPPGHEGLDVRAAPILLLDLGLSGLVIFLLSKLMRIRGSANRH